MNSVYPIPPDITCVLCGEHVSDIYEHIQKHPNYAVVECYICATAFLTQVWFGDLAISFAVFSNIDV